MKNRSVLVIGGGVAGIQASLDLANRGVQVCLVEENPSIGGRMAQLDKTFPTMDCSICILAPKMVEVSRNKNIEILSYCEVKEVKGSIGNFEVKIVKKPRYVDEEKCNGCGRCAEVCPIEIPSEFNASLNGRRAIYIPFPQAIPMLYVVDIENCLTLSPTVCGRCMDACDREAIIPNQKPEELVLKVDAIIVATGYDLFDPSVIEEYGYMKYENVITSLEFERIVCGSGPFGGALKRPSDLSNPPKRIAFIQCVGSRSLRHGIAYCSAVCCMYATKEAILAKEHEPNAEVYIFYNEIRTFGKGFETFIDRARTEYGIQYVRAFPGEISEDPDTKNLIIRYEDTLDQKVKELEADLVVLCPALIPSDEGRKLANILRIELDEYGFVKSPDPVSAPMDTSVPGIYACGFCLGPKDISDSVAQASGAAARALEALATLRSSELK
jgi:heterodisulfide reductase subunit A